MQNTSKINTILLVIVIILLAVGIWALLVTKNKTYTAPIASSDLNTDIKSQASSSTTPINNTSNINWIKSPKFGLYYSDKFSANEYYRTSENGIAYTDSGNLVPEFSVVSNTDNDLSINWGGYKGLNPNTCTISDFTYGVSDSACIRGYVAWVARSSARSTITSNDLKLFGDFVLKNK